MSRHVDIQSQRVVPVGALLTTLLVSLGVAYWFVPSRTELVTRLLLDQQYESYSQQLREMGDDVSPSDLSEMKADQVGILTTLFRLTPHEQLRMIFATSSPPEYTRHIHAMVLSAVRYLDVMRPDEAWALVSPHLARMSDKQVSEVCTVLAGNALALSQPKLAARIWKTAADQPNSSVETAEAMAQAYQWSGEPLTGAQQLQAWISQRVKKLPPADIATLSKRCADLALAGGQPGLAFDASLLAMNHLEVLDRDQVERAWKQAQQCNRMQQMRPWLQRYVRSLPQAKLELSALRAQGAKPDADMQNYRHWLLLAAHLSDWEPDFDSAFDHHLRLAALGSLESLDRIVALSNFLGRDDETAILLSLTSDVPERPELPLFRANLLASLGEDEAARPLLERWLKTHPDDRETAYAYACLLEDLGEEDASMEAFANVLKHHPNDVPALKKLAENYIRADRPADALKLYSKLKEQDHDHYTLENYALLAEAQEDNEQLLAAEALAARREKTAEAYLNIASTGRNLEDRDAAIALLKEGIETVPQSAGLRVGLAELLVLEGEEDDAVEVLMHPTVKQSYAGVSALLALSEFVPNKSALLNFVGDDLEKRFDLSMQTRLDLAVVCHQAGETDRCERLFVSVAQGKETWRAVAEARFDIGSYDEAARLMKLFLQDQRRATSDDWVFLGDIYDLMGRNDDARNAYNLSLTLLTSDLPDTAYREPSSAAVRPVKPPPTIP